MFTMLDINDAYARHQLVPCRGGLGSSDNNTACPITALCMDYMDLRAECQIPFGEMELEAALTLNVSETVITEFILGFDNKSQEVDGPEERVAYLLGVQARVELNPGKDE